MGQRFGIGEHVPIHYTSRRLRPGRRRKSPRPTAGSADRRLPVVFILQLNAHLPVVFVLQFRRVKGEHYILGSTNA
jgi:hypothetical protein